MWDTEQMKKKYVIGLNSGTSFDGIDVALVKFSRNLKVKLVDGFVYEYPMVVRERIRKLINPYVGAGRDLHLLREISQLNFLIGEIFAEAANTITDYLQKQSGSMRVERAAQEITRGIWIRWPGIRAIQVVRRIQ